MTALNALVHQMAIALSGKQDYGKILLKKTNIFLSFPIKVFLIKFQLLYMCVCIHIYIHTIYMCIYICIFFFIRLCHLPKFLALLRYNWHMTLYNFKMYYVRIWFMYILWNDTRKGLVNTSVSSHSYKFFLEVKTFKIYSFSNFQIYNTVLLTMVVLFYIIS